MQLEAELLVASPVSSDLQLSRNSPTDRKLSYSFAGPCRPCSLGARLSLRRTSCARLTLPTLRSYPTLITRLGRPNAILLPELQEITNLPCDTGLERVELEADPELDGLNFSVLDQTVEKHGVPWTSKRDFFDASNVEERAKWVKRWLKARGEDKIVGESD